MEDNIEEPTLAEMQDSTAPAAVPQPTREYFNIHEACELIAQHYGRGFKRLSFSPPMQIVDGCVAEFIDDDMKVIVAAARMRFRNRVHVDKENGQMRLEIVMSDLTFNRSRLELSVGNPVMM
jgi:hypothetical protein